MSQKTPLLVSVFDERSLMVMIDEATYKICFPQSDVIGVCSRFGGLQQGTSKRTGRKYTKRDITLVDNKS